MVILDLARYEGQMSGGKCLTFVQGCLKGVFTRSTQPCIPPGSLNRVPASAGVRAGMSPLPGGR